MTTIDTSVLSTIEDNVKYTMLQLMHEILKSYNQSLDIINDLNDNQQDLNSRLTTAESNISKNAGNISTLQGRVDTLDAQMAGTEDSFLYTRIKTLDNALDLFRNDLIETNTNVYANTAAISKINTKDLPAIRGSLTGITQNISEMQEQLNNVEEKADNLENDIINLESDYGSLLSNQNYISTIIRCTNSNVIQRGSNNYWSIPLPTPAKTTAEGYVFVCIATEVLSSGTDPLYIAFDDGSGVYTTFAQIVRFGGGHLTRSTFGVIAGNLVVLMLYDNSGTLEARVISQVLTA